ncbi:MAG: thiamine phosphate synthase [Hyphomicrobiales bacterium]|nr:thiamine phosphate synthase [Hyphomicrobiales bacterium]
MEASSPRLMLFSPKIADAQAFLGPLRAALSAGEVAALVLDLADTDERGLVNMVKLVAPVAQAEGAAVLICERADLVTRSGADGVHLRDPIGLDPALDLLKRQDRIVGTGGLRLRDDAMAAAEKGADYVLFGEDRADGSRRPLASVIERVSWWAGIFETPCVAFAGSLDEIDELAATGAEFVAVGEALWTSTEGPAAATTSALQRLTRREAA